ncbi:hypothetical protein SLEP1_g26443 [Rubroshorea leprosula]|uniref:Uncharacterized protein n=1 Tax=Rubroshorea leprosula TaxID=152421 RepID=A0AAV5JVP1_9ROSI|nr:hypothetical protein SLEP1_g26443 [Rubroshorea leprosula]
MRRSPVIEAARGGHEGEIWREKETRDLSRALISDL